jgi:hypothetical protein
MAVQSSKTFEHPYFGTFVLDSEVDWYAVSTVWDGKPVQLILETDEATELEVSLQFGLLLWENQSSWNQQILDYIVQELLNHKNTIWLDEEEAPLSAEEFISQIRLDEILVAPDGEFSFWYKDGLLFFGHSIVVRGGFQNGLRYARIEG